MEETLQPRVTHGGKPRVCHCLLASSAAVATACKQAVAHGFGLALILLFATGCITPQPLSLPKWDTPPKGPVAQVMPLWADGIVVQTDPMRRGLPTPGLAARVYLFGGQLGEPLLAEGSLIVYQYDDLQPVTDPQVPREIWNLDKASLEKLLKKDALGWGYNLWLPWSNYHPDIKRVMLVVCYRPEKGVEAWSGQHVLPLTSNEPGPIALGPKNPSHLNVQVSRVRGAEDHRPLSKPVPTREDRLEPDRGRPAEQGRAWPVLGPPAVESMGPPDPPPVTVP